jgi:hypothetical protein
VAAQLTHTHTPSLPLFLANTHTHSGVTMDYSGEGLQFIFFSFSVYSGVTMDYSGEGLQFEMNKVDLLFNRALALKEVLLVD